MTQTQHVLIVGIDGVRFDVLTAEPTPRLDRLAARGFLAPLRVNDAGPTISGPSWTTIVTGVLADQHGIYGNDFTPNHLDEHPDLVTLARRQRPELDSFVAAAWLPLVTTDSGGPMFAGGGHHPNGRQAHSVSDWEQADQWVTDACVDFITNHDGAAGSLVFCYLGGVDEVGHLEGVGPTYRRFVAESDQRLGQLLDAVETRSSDEQWTILVVTDHGHIDAGGHGGESELERTAWIAAAGTDVPTTAPACVEQADIAGHAIHLLGLDAGEIFGTPLGTRPAH